MVVQTEVEVDDVMKVQVKIEAVGALPLEIRSSFGSLYTPLESERQQSKFECEELPCCGLDINDHVCNFNKLMINGIGG